MRKIVLSFMFCLLGAIVLFAQDYAGPKSYFGIGIMKGTIKGALVTYKDSIAVTITPGYGECNGKYWEITEAVDLSILPGPNYDVYYILISDANSSYPTPFIYARDNGSPGPTWSDSHLGWYLGNDRCIGVVFNDEATMSFLKFTVSGDGNLVRFIQDECMATMVAAGTPTGSWVDIEGLDTMPVTSTAAHIFAYQTDSGSYVDLSITSYENATAGNVCRELACVGYNRASVNGWIQLGPSREMSWRGAADDDAQSTYIYLNGFEYKR